MSEWISIEDRTPPETDDYLTYCELDDIPTWAVHTWFESRGHFSCETHRDRYITHWQPLPSPPEDI
jgi:hypothetical protein